MDGITERRRLFRFLQREKKKQINDKFTLCVGIECFRIDGLMCKAHIQLREINSYLVYFQTKRSVFLYDFCDSVGRSKMLLYRVQFIRLILEKIQGSALYPVHRFRLVNV